MTTPGRETAKMTAALRSAAGMAALLALLPFVLATGSCRSAAGPASRGGAEPGAGAAGGPTAGRLPAPADLPPLAHGILRSRMARHSQDMTAMVWAVVMIDYAQAKELAEAIASDTSLARPLTGDATELNARLPEAFFKFQDDLRARAGKLAAAAGRRDADGTAEAYGEMSRACVGCHAAYRAEPTGLR